MKKLQETIHKYMKARNWDDLPPADIAKSVSIEAAELLEHFQWQNWSKEDIKKNKEKYEEIKAEIGDIVIYCAEMANILSFDLEIAANNKLKKAAKKYPAHLFKNNKDPHGTGVYEKIKKEYRKNKFKS
ncbi:MAG: nucleotide pyrophosphohydrolase [Candidatus Taylorbacteria bacterium]|nr:nucleotide pyrophosphohydrolase [Candidatus Taylorbacteria bacterium]